MQRLQTKYYDPHAPSGFSSRRKLAANTGVKEDKVKKWLEYQETYTLHKPVIRKYRHNMVVVNGIDEQWGADLCDMQAVARHNDGYKYILTVIDIFSRHAWALPLKNKSAESTVDAFETIFRQRKPLKLQTDKGKEFVNKEFRQLMKKYGINHFLADNPDIKCAHAERFNKTLKEKIFKWFTYTGKNRYVDVLQDFVDAYNNTVHSAIKMAPNEVSKENMLQVYRNQYGKVKRFKAVYKFEIGDLVRITQAKLPFQKGYLPRWSKEVFVIDKRLPRDPVVYKLKDLNGEEIESIFYEKELQRWREKTFT